MLKRVAVVCVLAALAGCQTMNSAWEDSKSLLGLNDDDAVAEQLAEPKLSLGTAAAPAVAPVPAVAPAPAPAPAPKREDYPALTLAKATVSADQPLATFKVAKQSYAEEATNFGTPPVSSLIPTGYAAPTPITVAGGKLIDTHDLHKLLTAKNPPVLINALPGDSTELIPGSVWLSGSGAHGRFTDAIQTQLGQHLQQLTKNKKDAPVVFYCLDVRCWHSYNAAIRATLMGYKNVYWYRGGLRAWNEAGLPHYQSSEDRW